MYFRSLSTTNKKSREYEKIHTFNVKFMKKLEHAIPTYKQSEWVLHTVKNA